MSPSCRLPSVFILLPAFAPPQLSKYEAGEFGACPRHLCNGAPCLPLGMSGNLREGATCLFCPKCEDVYRLPASAPSTASGSTNTTPAAAATGEDGDDNDAVGPPAPTGAKAPSSVSLPGDLDGAYFGPSFPHMLLLMKPSLLPPKGSGNPHRSNM